LVITEAGGRRQEAGGGKQEAGSRKQEAGSRKQEAGSRKREAGSGRLMPPGRYSLGGGEGFGGFGGWGEARESDTLAGAETAIVAGEFAGLELAVVIKDDEVSGACGIGEGVPASSAAGDALDELIADEGEGAGFAVAVKIRGRGAGAAETMAAAEAVSGKDRLTGEREAMGRAFGPELDDGAAGNTEIAERGGAGEGALIEGSVGIEPGIAAIAGVTLNGGFVEEPGTDGVGFGGRDNADRGGEEQENQRQVNLLHG
jgi:hypothetical protein